MEKGKQARRARVASLALAGLLAVAVLSSIVSFAYDADGAGQVRVQNAGEAQGLVYGALPRWSAIAGVPSQIDAPGDLYLIDATGVSRPVSLSLHLVNPGEVARSYAYLHLKVGVYEDGPGGWSKAIAADGQSLEETYLTLLNGQASFFLAGGKRYVITVDDGAYYAKPAGGRDTGTSIKFFVSVTQ
ncbi:MAG: hypothetical protein Q8O40_01220 [Chloroflexota bacterium]|nr:hypothetical protein [Chloroflexota bacterium]